jgi:hypothetical protein
MERGPEVKKKILELMLADLREMWYKHDDASGRHLYVVLSNFLQSLSHNGNKNRNVGIVQSDE